MRSPAYGSFSRNIRNPTLMAMLGSAGFHAVLAMFSLLKPAESQPGRLRIVSLVPPGTVQTALGAKKATTLPVPSGVPPINMSNVPQFGELPGTTPFALPSGALLPKSNISSIDLRKLRTADLPQRSFSVAKSLDFSQSASQNSGNLPSPTAGQMLANQSGNFGSSRSGTFVPPPLPQNPAMPNVASGPMLNGNGLNGLYSGQTPAPFSSPDGSTVPSSSDPANPTDPGNSTESVGVPPVQASSPEAKSSVRNWLQAQSLRYGQQISVQTGRPLIATNASEACDAKQGGTVRVAAIYAPNKTFPLNDAIEIIESASTPGLNQAASRAVRKFPIEPAGAYQSFTYSVAVPYSESFCQALQQKTPASSPKPTDTASPEPTPTGPELTPTGPSKQTSQPKPATEPAATPPSAQSNPTTMPTVPSRVRTSPLKPNLPSSNSSPLQSEPLFSPTEPITPSNVPLPRPDVTKPESPKASPEPKTDSSLLGPLPSPAISPSEAAPSPSP